MIRWFANRNEELFFCAITVTEIAEGIAKLRRTGALRRSEILRAWFERVLQHYGERVLPFDLAPAHIAAELADVAKAEGRHPGFADIAIAAIAKARELVVLTRNTRHFAPLGVVLFDPFEMS
jgi:predicted nucleic acid-binding protein